MRVFSMFGGLGGDFNKDTYEAKLFGMIVEGFLYCGQVMVPNRFGDILSRTCVLGRK